MKPYILDAIDAFVNTVRASSGLAPMSIGLHPETLRDVERELFGSERLRVQVYWGDGKTARGEQVTGLLYRGVLLYREGP